MRKNKKKQSAYFKMIVFFTVKINTRTLKHIYNLNVRIKEWYLRVTLKITLLKYFIKINDQSVIHHPAERAFRHAAPSLYFFGYKGASMMLYVHYPALGIGVLPVATKYNPISPKEETGLDGNTYLFTDVATCSSPAKDLSPVPSSAYANIANLA